MKSIPLKAYNEKVHCLIVGGVLMQFLSTSQMAEKWNVSRRLVTKYCDDNRIPGAISVGNRWMIPEDAVKPQDPRKSNKNEKI